MIKHIRSRDNPDFRILRGLTTSARERHDRQRVVLDGQHLVRSYAERYGRPALLALSEAVADDPLIGTLVADTIPDRVILLSPTLFAQVSPVETPSGVLAVVAMPRIGAFDPECSLAILIDSVQDPGNVGTLIRSAAAFGADAVLLSPRCADPWSPKVLRAAMGGHFHTGVHARSDLLEAARRFRGRVVAMAGAGGRSLLSSDLSAPLALIFGSEGRGISTSLLSVAHEIITIPMRPGVESLNVGAAGAIALFEHHRQHARMTATVARAE